MSVGIDVIYQSFSDIYRYLSSLREAKGICHKLIKFPHVIQKDTQYKKLSKSRHRGNHILYGSELLRIFIDPVIVELILMLHFLN
jgi:hypothetical protein